MAKKYEVDGKYFLPVTVFTTDARSINPIGVQYVFAGNGNKGTTYLDDYPDLLLTAEEVAENVDTIARSTLDEYSEKAQRKIEALTKQLEEANETIRAFSESENIVRTNFYAKVDENKELKTRNAELESLLKEVMATRDEAIRQNDELIADRNNWKEAAQRYHDSAKVADAAADNLRKENGELKAKVAELIVENDNLKSDCNDWKDTADDRIIDVQNLTAERDNLKADLATQKEVNEELKTKITELTAWYEEANKTASEAADANDDLKAKIADLRNRVGEQLAQIQDLNAEIHFHKEFGEGLDKQQKELQARYDELDSVNKEQAEKIRKLDAERDTWERNAKAWKMTADGMSKRAEELQAENEKLNNRNKYLESEKKRKPIVHVLTNDGHVYAFTSNGKVSVKYHTELNILMIEDGEKTIAGFSRGDKPGNLSAWWMG